MPKSKRIKAIDREIDRVLDGIKSLDAESREYLRPMLRRYVLESTRPEEVVLEHIRANHEITRGYVFPEGSGDDEAMFILQHQAIVGEDYLWSIAKKVDPPCEHRPRMTDGPHPRRMFTIKEQVIHVLEGIEKQKVEGAVPAESTPQIEAVVANYVERFSEVLDEEQKKLITDAYRSSILNSTDPKMIIRRRLSRYEDEAGVLDVPESEPLDRALKLLLVRRDIALTGLKVIATSNLSCGDHHVVYAGGNVSEGNRIYTAQKIARNSLKDLDDFLLEPRPVKDVLREILADLTEEDG